MQMSIGGGKYDVGAPTVAGVPTSLQVKGLADHERLRKVERKFPGCTGDSAVPDPDNAPRVDDSLAAQCPANLRVVLDDSHTLLILQDTVANDIPGANVTRASPPQATNVRVGDRSDIV